MIYLLNNTDPQEIYIPKNTSGVNPHKSNSYWDGFEDGYESGETHQKNLLSSVTFTENGEYERENGWSAVTVDVPQTGSTVRLEEKTVVISADTTNVTPSSGYDGMSAVTVDASSYAQENYDDGFDDGFTDGYASGSTDEKAKLSAVTFTTNTAVTISDGGYSAITVNVPQTGSSLNVEANKPYTATTNGNYTITPTSASTTLVMDYDDGDDFYFTASTYPSVGRFEIGTIIFWNGDGDRIGSVDIYYDNGQIDYDDSDWGYRIYTGTTGNTMLYVGFYEDDYENCTWIKDDGYNLQYDAMSAVSLNVNVDTASTYNDGYNDAMDDIEDGAQTLSVSANGTYNTGLRTEGYLWHEVIVDVPQTGSSAVLGTKTITENGTYSASTDSLDGYSAITVNVQTGSSVTYVEYLETDGSEISWDTGVKLEDPSEIVYFDFAPLTGSASGDAYFPFLSQQYNDGVWNLAIRTIGGGYQVYGVYQTRFGDARNDIQYSVGNKNVCVISVTGATVNGVDYPEQATGLYTVDWNIIINGQKKSDGFMRFPVARYYGFKIMSGETAVIDLKPALDGNDVPCFYDEVSKTYIYHSGSGTPIAGPVSPSSDYMSGFTDGYASGFTDGYNSGYTDGQDNIIGTFTAMTATTNGVYGSSANPLSSITVNVPQTGSSATLGTGSFSANGTYNASTDNLDGYSAITINVQSSGSTDLRYFIEGTYQDWPDTFNIPAGTKYIRPYCFAEYDLLDIIVPSSVTGMGEYAFYKSSIRYFKKENNCVIENIPKYAFAECHSLDADGWPVFNDVLSIDEYAFSDCNSQDFNTVSACCVTKIGIYAFNGCTGLTTVMLGGNLMSISYGAFNGCSNLRNIYMLSTTVPIGSNYAFIGIPNSGTFHYPRGSDYSSLQNLSVFSGWTFTGDL